MFRKILAVIVLVNGGFFLLGGGMLLLLPLAPLFSDMSASDMEPPSAGEMGVTVIVFAVFTAIGMGLILGGAAIWDWKRWRIVLGVVFTVAGGDLVLNAVTLPLMMLSSEWKLMQEQMTRVPPSYIMNCIIASCALFGPLLLAIGIPLIIKQRRRDKQAKAEAATHISGA